MRWDQSAVSALPKTVVFVAFYLKPFHSSLSLWSQIRNSAPAAAKAGTTRWQVPDPCLVTAHLQRAIRLPIWIDSVD